MTIEQTILFAGAGVLVLLMGWRGWRLGIVRQALSILALVAGYGAGWFGGSFLIPVLRPLGFPDRLLTILGGFLLGFFTYIAISMLAALLFKRTAQQSVGLVRFGFGLAGAVLGVAFGIFLTVVLAVAIRLVGSVAEVSASSTEANAAQFAPGAWTSGLASLKQTLEQGPAGAMLQKVDPVPDRVYDTLNKVGQMAVRPDSLERFAGDPNVKSIAVHPKIVALQNDPEIVKAVHEHDFMTLLRHPRIVAAANDPEVLKLIGAFDFENALDFALRSPEKTPAR
jgi:uncharacterized membrane protein required for colicin V production